VIHVIGVDLSALSGRQTHQGTISGVAYLEGTFSDLTLHVTYQERPRPWPDYPRFDVPPCPAPAGGWARSSNENPDYSAVGAYRRRFPSEVISVESLRPGSHTWVVTLASIDPARTFAALKSDYPRRLCVVRSLYTRTEVFRARKLVNALLPPENIGQPPYVTTVAGQVFRGDGQSGVEVGVVFDTPEIHRALASLPEGLVLVVPWLHPVSP
jgi:hypothetical protein